MAGAVGAGRGAKNWSHSEGARRAAHRGLNLAAVALLLAAFHGMSARPAAAATQYWDRNGESAGSGNLGGDWSAPNWSDSPTGDVATAAWVPGNDAVFSAGTDAGGTLAIALVNDNTSVRNISVEEGAITLGTSGSLSLATNALWTVNASRSLTVSRGIVGDYGLTKDGTGKLTLQTVANTYSGTTTVNAGRLALNRTDSIKAGNSVVVASGATLSLVAGGTYTVFNVAAAGPGDGGSGAGALTFGDLGENQNRTFGGAIELDGTVGATLAQRQGLNGVSRTITLNGAIGGSGTGAALTLRSSIGGGTTRPVWRLNAQSSYQGPTTFLSSGTCTVQLGIDDALPTGTALTMDAGGGTSLFDLNGFSQTLAGLATAGRQGAALRPVKERFAEAGPCGRVIT